MDIVKFEILFYAQITELEGKLTTQLENIE